jgi:glycolate oxidase FAD binding subunit
LGLTVVRPDGTIAKAGSKAVKNVAGYDVQRLFIGARGTLGIVVQVILRTFPTKALPPDDLEVFRGDRPPQGLIQRTLATEFEQAVSECGGSLLATHPGTATFYRTTDGTDRPEREGWQLGWGLGDRNLEILDPENSSLMRRAKQIFDPTAKLNPGEFGL